MKFAERLVMVLLLFAIVGGGAWIYFTMKYEHQQVVDAVARGEYEIRPEAEATVDETNWRVYYPNTVPATIGSTTVIASVADTLSERIKGLSNTPFLPENVVKLFAFGTAGSHSIWMKDMNYAIDILWVSENGHIVHIEENIAPETYPESFASPVPAWYVIETNAGFVEANQINLNDRVTVSVE